MLKADVQIGKIYIAKISGRLVRVRLDSVSQYGGWNATNLLTHREVRIRSAAKLRREFNGLKASNLAIEIARGLNTQTHEG